LTAVTGLPKEPPPSAPEAAAAAAAAADEQWQQNLVLRSYVRYRWPIFALVVVIILACFNGRWRIARDSALYRGVARSMVAGNGYTFRGDHERHVYPGFPLILAGIERVFGRQDPMRPLASQVVLVAMALLTLVVIYHAIRLYFPPWIAVCVTTGVGVNCKFVQNAHELMSDVPFLLGVSTALLGIGMLMRCDARGRRIGGVLLMFAGGALALATRPTFWSLAVAWAMVSAIGLIVGPRRGAYALMLLALLALVAAFFALDPRSEGAPSALAGKYEQKALATLRDVSQFRLGERAIDMFEESVPEIFYGLELGVGIDTVASVVILGSTVLLVRTVPLWALYVAVTAVMLFIFGPIPRYFLMVLPMLLLGVLLLLYRVSLLVPRRRYLPELVIFLGTAATVAPNLVRDADLFMEQHALTFDGRVGFLDRYHRGELYPVVAISEAIADPASGFHVEPDQPVLSHEPRIMSFLSGRRVYRAGELVSDGDDAVTRAAEKVRAMNFEFGVFPATVYDPDEPTRTLIEREVITPVPDAPALVVKDLRFTRIRIAPRSAR
jgi:hypothetical protein